MFRLSRDQVEEDGMSSMLARVKLAVGDLCFELDDLGHWFY